MPLVCYWKGENMEITEQFTDLCHNCNAEITISEEEFIFRILKCPNCGKYTVLCSKCNAEEMDCKECIHEDFAYLYNRLL